MSGSWSWGGVRFLQALRRRHTSVTYPCALVPLIPSQLFLSDFHVENSFGSQALVNPQLRQQVNMAFVKKRHILLADERAEKTG